MKYTVLVLLLTITYYGYAQDTFVLNESKLLERLETLSSNRFEGRRTGEKGNAMARNYIIDEFIKLNVDSFGKSYAHSFSFTNDDKEYEGVNVLAKIEGTLYPDKFIVISAHYDHLGVKNGTIYNGADDDASGIAALFSFAAYLKKNPPKHSVILAAFDAEELGLQGSSYFVDKMKNSSVMVNMNMDMISRSKKNELYAVGARYNSKLKEILSAFKNTTTTVLLQGHDGTDGKQDWTQSSDHGPFHSAKIPFLYFGDEDHPGYHNPSDDFENITPKFYLNSVKIILSIFSIVDTSGL